MDLSVLSVVDLDELAEAARVVVVWRFSIPESLEHKNVETETEKIRENKPKGKY